MTKGHKPAGGPKSKNVTEPRVRTGSGSKGISEGWVSQRGNKVGNHITDDKNTGYRGEPKFTGKNFQPVKFGNEVALNVGKGGCGTGRTLYGQSGSQGTHGATNPGKPGLPSTKGQWPD
jgi:hypothetical protein